MGGRAAGVTCKRAVEQLEMDGSNWNAIAYDKNGGGCGASMRAACLGLAFHNQPQKMIELAIETGRATHHNPLGYLGAVAAAYFTSLALRSEDPNNWLPLLFK
jgi:ADP-ribosylarginine hydrolase